jgi:ubiquinone biosynthesis protein
MNPFLWLLVWLPLLVVIAWVSRRLIGVQRLSLTRTVIAGVIGLVLGSIFAAGAERSGASDEDVVLSGIVLSILFTMVAILVLALLSRPGAGPRRPRLSAPHPIKAVRRNVAAARRGSQVTRIAVRHGLGPLLGLGGGGKDLRDDPADLGRRMRGAMEEAGGIFVKLGQLIASRDDLIPPEMARELSGLQQEVAPEPPDVVRGVVEEELGAPVEEVFAEFDWDPIGAASIGQVFTARLQSGEAVVVKVRRTGIVESVEVDLDIVTRLAAGAERRTSWGAQFEVSAVAEEFAANLREELDFTIEVRNMGEVAIALADTPEIHLPDVYTDMCSERVLVMERLDGEPLGRIDSVAALGLDGRALADTLFRAELDSMVSGQTFHADPHPGNVMIFPDGRLGLIDFGSASRLDAFEQAAVSDILMAEG